MPVQIIVSQLNQYQVAGIGLWKIQIGNKILRDLSINPNKMVRRNLIDLLEHAGINGLSGR